MKRFTCFFIFFSLLLFSKYSFCQIDLSKSIDSLIGVTNPRFFNGVILISKNGNAVYQKSYGYSSLNKKTALQLDDQFLIASISKQFTATLVLAEMQAGRIQADQTIRHYLPAFEQKWADSITIQQLLNHTSGIISWNKSLTFIPGTKFSYSNINYTILGKIIEKTSGKTYAALTSDLFKRCKMNSTTVPPGPDRKSDHKKLVNGHSETVNEKYQEENIMNLLDSPMMGVPAAGIISTAGDLAAWMYCLHNGKLLADSTYQLMMTNGVIRPHRWGEVKYADGIQVDHMDNVVELSMSGYVPGFISTIIYYPETKVSMAVLENISPSPSDMNRVYYFHDQVRKIIRNSF